MTRKEPPGRLPWYKRNPGSFLRGIAHMTVEQIAVYAVLLDILYDTWEPIEDRTPKQRRDLARTSGLSVRKFGTTLDELLALGKLYRTLSGRLSNRKFDLLAKDRGIDTAATSTKSGKKTLDNRGDNRPDNEAPGNGINGLEGEKGAVRARANLELRTENLEQNSADPGLSKDAELTVESEISLICRAMGVDLQASTHRHGWAYRWARMRTDLDITVDDMVAAIETFKGQRINFETVKSLGLFKDRAIEKRVARTLNDRIAGRSAAAAPPQAELTDQQWIDFMRLFLKHGTWPPSKGPSPFQPGCRVPPYILEQAELKWIEQGNHPTHMTLEGTGLTTWREHNAGPIAHPIAFAPRSKA